MQQTKNCGHQRTERKNKKMHNKKTLSMYVTATFNSKSYTSRRGLSCVAYYERSSYWRKVWH